MRPGLTREARVFRALAHPTRLAILQILRHRPVCVCHLTTALSCTQPYVSQHLAVLRQAGLIKGQKDGAFVYYTLRDYSVLGVIDMVSGPLGRAPGATPAGAERLEGCACPQCTTGAAPAKGAA